MSENRTALAARLALLRARVELHKVESDPLRKGWLSRWLAGAPGGIGGQFAPKGEGDGGSGELVAPQYGVGKPLGPPPGWKAHLKAGDDGESVAINYPSRATHQDTWKDAKATAVFTPGSATPTALGDYAMRPWRPMPTGWASVTGTNPALDAEHPFVPIPNKTTGTGVVIVEPDGRVWLAKPTNHYGGYRNTFPKGTLESGLTMQQNAIKEAWEETGLKVKITGILGDYERDTSHARFYIAQRTSGTPADMGWESQAVSLAPLKDAARLLNRDVDQEILADVRHVFSFHKAFDPNQARDPSGKWTAGQTAFMEDFHATSYDNPLMRNTRVYGWKQSGEGATDTAPHFANVELRPEADGSVHIAAIQAFDAGERRGTGSEALRRVTALADKHAITLTLGPKKFGDKGLSTPQLKKWYGRHGFTNTQSDWAAMERKPGAGAVGKSATLTHVVVRELPEINAELVVELAEHLEDCVVKAFDPSQPRDDHGRWGGNDANAVYYRHESGRTPYMGVTYLAIDKSQAEQYALGNKGVPSAKHREVSSYSTSTSNTLDFVHDPKAQAFALNALKANGDYGWLTAEHEPLRMGHNALFENKKVIEAARKAGYDSFLVAEYPKAGSAQTLVVLDHAKVKRIQGSTYQVGKPAKVSKAFDPDEARDDHGRWADGAAGSGHTEGAPFKAWFGDSKVVDAAGKPLIVYHGTPADISEFDASHSAGINGAGAYFTTSPGEASTYAAFGGEGANVLPVYLRITNPMQVGGKTPTRFSAKDGSLAAFTRAFSLASAQFPEVPGDGVMYMAGERFASEAAKSKGGSLTVSDVISLVDSQLALNSAKNFLAGGGQKLSLLRTAFEILGYDGIVDNTVPKRSQGKMDGVDKTTRHFIAFGPTQIKSAIGNTKFNRKSPDISKAFDPNQARDAHGEWTSEGGEQSLGFVSPNIDENVALTDAIERQHSERTVLLEQAAVDARAYFGVGSLTEQVGVGAWSDGAEQSVIITGNADPDKFKRYMALLGLISEQKAVVYFSHHEGGADSVYKMSVPGKSLQEVHQTLLDTGVAFHTLQATDSGIDVYVFNQGTDEGTKNGFQAAGERLGVGTGETIRGTGDILGSFDSREEGRVKYEAVLDEGDVRVDGSHAGWRSVRDRWAGQLAQVHKRHEARVAKGWETQQRWPSGSPLGGQWSETDSAGLAMPAKIAGGLEGKNPSYQKQINAAYAAAQSGDKASLLAIAAKTASKLEAFNAGKITSSHVKYGASVNQYVTSLISGMDAGAKATITAEAIAGPLELASLGDPVGSKPGGSNPGAIYKIDGDNWLVKGNAQAVKGSVTPEVSDRRAANEVLASKLLLAAGAGAPEMRLVNLGTQYGGGLGVATRMIPGLVQMTGEGNVSAAQKDFATQAWLANYDALGQGFDNTLFKDGKAVNIDPGGALYFRAQGAPKDEALQPGAPEFASMRNTTSEQKAIYGKMTASDLTESAAALKGVSDATITKLVDTYWPGDQGTKDLTSQLLIDRRDAVLAQAGYSKVTIEGVVSWANPSTDPAPSERLSGHTDLGPAPWTEADFAKPGLAKDAEIEYLHSTTFSDYVNPEAQRSYVKSAEKAAAELQAVQGGGPIADPDFDTGAATLNTTWGQAQLNSVKIAYGEGDIATLAFIYGNAQYRQYSSVNPKDSQEADWIKSRTMFAMTAIAGKQSLAAVVITPVTDIPPKPTFATGMVKFDNFYMGMANKMEGLAKQGNLEGLIAMGKSGTYAGGAPWKPGTPNGTKMAAYHDALVNDLQNKQAALIVTAATQADAIVSKPVAVPTPEQAQAKNLPAMPKFEGYLLDSNNSNSSSVNAKIMAMKALAEAGDVKGLLALNYGTNTYGKQQTKLANNILAALDSPYSVTAGQKKNSNPALTGTKSTDELAAAAAKIGATLPAPSPAPGKISATQTAAASQVKSEPIYNIPAKPDFLNWNGAGKGLSAKPALNVQNEQIAAKIFELASAGKVEELKALTFPVLDKETGVATGVTLPITEHPSHNVTAYFADALTGATTPYVAPHVVTVSDFNRMSPVITQVSEVFASESSSKAFSSLEKIGRYGDLGKLDGAARVAMDAWQPAKELSVTAGTISSHDLYESSLKNYDALSKVEQAAIKEYTGSGYKTMNNPETGEGSHSKVGYAIAGIDKASMALQPGTILSRMFRINSNADVQKLLKSEGHVIQDFGIISTSVKSGTWSGDTQLRITVSDGVKGLFVGRSASGGSPISSNSSEQEVLLPYGTRFYVRKVYASGTKFTDKHGSWGHASSRLLDVVALPNVSE